MYRFSPVWECTPVRVDPWVAVAPHVEVHRQAANRQVADQQVAVLLVGPAEARVETRV